jgi:cell division protein FtsB
MGWKDAALTPVFLCFAALGVGVVFLAVSAYVASRNSSRKNEAILTELNELRDEVVRLRKENESLKNGRDACSTGIKKPDYF